MIKPMLAETAKQPFDSNDFIYELKLDGIRCIAYLDGCIVDGEIACADFNDIQHRIHRENPLDIKFAVDKYPARYSVFDILNLDGERVTSKRLIDRKLLLGENFAEIHKQAHRLQARSGQDITHKFPELIGGANTILHPFQQGGGVELFEKVKLLGQEGIMAKNIYSPYLEGKRSGAWLKIKAFTDGIFHIVGLTRGKNDRERTFGALILADSQLNYVGCAGSGLNGAMLDYILQAVTPTECALKQAPKLDSLVWCKPELFCEVRYLGYGSEGHLRFPTFRKLLRGRE